MSSLSVFDIIIMVLFCIISFSIYKMLKPDNTEEKIIPVNIKNGKIVNINTSKIKIEEIITNTLKNESLDLKVEKIKKLDKTFDIQLFMSNAKELFESIFKSFYAKENLKIKSKVSNEVFNEFENTVNELNKNKQNIVAELIRFKSIIVKDISINQKIVNIIVEFTSEQTAVMKDSAGKILKGDENQLETIIDIWNFSKDFSQKDSSWILQGTIEG